MQKVFEMEKPVKISGVVITYNEEKNLGMCLQSLKGVVDEIVIVDSFSKDKTEKIAHEYDAVFIQHPFDGHIEQKNYAASVASHNIILSLDADEALNDALRQEIIKIKSDWQKDGYWVNRLNQYAGRWIRHGSWYPDRKIRLFDRRKAKWGGHNPHDKIIMDGSSMTGRLKGNLLHYTYDPEDIVEVYTEHMNQINFFATKWAESAKDRGKRVIPLWHLVLRPPLQFLWEFVFLHGFLDGSIGFVMAKHSAWHKYLKYLKLHGMYAEERKR